MEFIYTAIEGFVLKLPPLLQLIFGAAVVMLILRVMVGIGDFFENRKKGKEE